MVDCENDFVKGIITGLFSGLAGGVLIAGLGAWLWEKALHRQFFSSIPAAQDERYRLRNPREPASDRH